MNLFEGLLGRGATPRFDTPSAVMTMMVAAMMSDGRIEDDELLQIEAICLTSPLFERNSRTDNRRLIMGAARLVEDHGTEKACRLAGDALTPALRETAFTGAAQVIFSDGYIDALEREIMSAMADWLGIEAGRARALVELASVMQHPETA